MSACLGKGREVFSYFSSTKVPSGAQYTPLYTESSLCRSVDERWQDVLLILVADAAQSEKVSDLWGERVRDIQDEEEAQRPGSA